MCERQSILLFSASQAPDTKKSTRSSKDDALIVKVQGQTMKWEGVSKHLHSLTSVCCRLYHWKCSERRSGCDVQVSSLSPLLMPMTKPTTISKAHPQVAKFTYGPGGTCLATDAPMLAVSSFELRTNPVCLINLVSYASFDSGLATITQPSISDSRLVHIHPSSPRALA
ncbi:Uncharacterized protein HZ326_27520 [Fusarium oxysporum f. sp. albedinis]|nr:Uncharacterized protein HZ326_27520 [Fusarium oxysporum f. sp. albedinis]